VDADRHHRTRADEQRFRALFASAYPALCRYAYHRGLTRADADDLVAEVLTIAWRRLDAVPVDDPTPWLFAVARNVWRNHLRSAARRDARRRGAPGRAGRPPCGGAFAARVPDRNLSYPTDMASFPTVDEIGRAMAALSDDDRDILRLVAWDGLTPAQVAVVLGCTPTTARVRLHRARARFAHRLDSAETRRVDPTDLHRERRSEEEVPDGQSNPR
jgi:RNA polymerase sigma-70 factor (ECF subfamily)